MASANSVDEAQKSLQGVNISHKGLSTKYACTVRLNLAPTLNVGNVLSGNRSIVHVTGGSIKGDGISGECVGGGDWITMDAKGVSRLDVRIVYKMDDDSLVYCTYAGILVVNEKVGKILTGSPDAKSTDFDDHYWRAFPSFETTSEKYGWLTTKAFIAKGKFSLDDSLGPVHYEVYQVE